jgi:hypothetical protein
MDPFLPRVRCERASDPAYSRCSNGVTEGWFWINEHRQRSAEHILPLSSLYVARGFLEINI